MQIKKITLLQLLNKNITYATIIPIIIVASLILIAYYIMITYVIEENKKIYLKTQGIIYTTQLIESQLL